jgi:hypothetical protein
MAADFEIRTDAHRIRAGRYAQRRENLPDTAKMDVPVGAAVPKRRIRGDAFSKAREL